MHNKPLILNAVANYGQIQWYYNGKSIERSFPNGKHGNVYNITRKLSQNEHEIVQDNQTLVVKGESRSGTYQVLATGFNEQQVSKHTEVTSYSKCTAGILRGYTYAINFLSITIAWNVFPNIAWSHVSI